MRFPTTSPAILGVSAYVILTGEFLVQNAIPSPEVLWLEIASVILLALAYLLLLQRHLAAAELRRNRATIERMSRVRALATMGYFVMDPQGGMRVDPVAAQTLGTGPQFSLHDLLRRIRPEDRAGLMSGAFGGPSGESRVLSFLLSADPEWSGAEDARYIKVHAWHEERPEGGQMTYGALIDLTQDHRREQDLAAALAAQSEQQDRQTQIFSIVSHELRTPASVISMLLEELDAGASWAAMGPRLRAVSDQLLSVLGDMRQTVRPEQNLPIRMEPFQPLEVAETVRNTFALMAEARQVEIDLNLSPAAWQHRLSDRVRLTQALSNLVKNAILHSGCRRITIDYSEEGEDGDITALWRVTDDGSGIPEETRATLFDAFLRGNSTSTARTDGSGLGLYITRSSMELLSGTVTYQPRAAGGSVFVLRVPVRPASDAATLADAAAPAEALSLSGLTVLVAEDSDIMGELLVGRLRRVFGRVVWVRDGEEALAAFGHEAPDVVLTDLFMPRLGGDSLTAALRQAGAVCPIIGMTAAAIGDERERFEAAGTDSVLTKPLSVAQIVEVLQMLAKEHGPQGNAPDISAAGSVAPLDAGST